MNHKARAKMLFNMHLGVKSMFEPKKSPGLAFYHSDAFMLSIMYLNSTDMSEGERIAHAYPNYEFVVQAKNGDLIVFSTEDGLFHPIRIMDLQERGQFLYAVNPENQNMETYWEQMNRIVFIPDTWMVWGAPL